MRRHHPSESSRKHNVGRFPLKVCFVVCSFVLLVFVGQEELRDIKRAFRSTQGVIVSRATGEAGAPTDAQTKSSSRDGDTTEKEAVDAEASSGRDDTKLLALVAYLSAPGNFAKRRLLRQTCLPEVWEQCRRFAAAMTMGGGRGRNRNRNGMNEANSDADMDASLEDARRICDVKFFVGQPNDPSVERNRKHQGALATELEIGLARLLHNETYMYGDLAVIPMRDTYQDLPDKTLHILREGALSGARIIVKIDDDRCPNMSSVLDIARTTRRNDARYVGHYLWKGDEYKIMKGADGRHGPYMSGPTYLVSSALARAVAIDDAAHSVLYMPYGSSSEDVDMGRWYQHAMGTHPHLNFTREVVWGIANNFDFKEMAKAEEANSMA